MDAVNAPSAETLADVLDAENAYAAAREALAAAEARRYAAIYAAVAEADPRAVRAMTPTTVTASTIRAAVRRCAPADSPWTQPELFDLDD